LENLSQYIEQTYLKPDFSDNTLYNLIEEAEIFGFKGICIPPFWVKKASHELAQKPIELVTVVGFPLGYNMTETKLEETRLALQDGATEIDMVINISAYLSEMNWTKIEIAKIAQLVHSKEKLLKVIIETAYLNNEQITDLCHICAEAGADFVKTSTGFAPEGAKTEHITLMRSNLPKSVGIKASGGIKTKEQAINLIKAGADRLGTSSGPDLIKN
jgi:deoxyribose-phosphate aldolase